MFLGRSRIPYPTTAFVDVLRKTTTRTGGRILQNGAEVLLYSQMPARVGTPNNSGANLGKPAGAGMESAREFLVGVGGLSVPTKILKADFVRIYWGTKPNLYAHPSIPAGFPPHLILKGASTYTLVWNPTLPGWSGDGYSIVWNDEWELFLGASKIGSFGTNRDFPQINCTSFPTGLSLLRFSGPPLDFTILRVSHEEDDQGKWHHTSLTVEYPETDKSPKL